MTIETEQAIAEPQVRGGVLPPLGSDERVSFTDVVLAHYLRQSALYRAAQPGAGSDEVTLAELADNAYQERLATFEAEHGRIVRAYWCTHEISGVAVTEKEERLPWWRLGRKEKRDRQGGPSRDPAHIRRIVERSNAELAEIGRYYDRAGANASRIVYAGGMLRGALLLACLTGSAGLVLWGADAFERHSTTTWTILAAIAAGGVGAGVSVLLRMARGNFAQDYEVGRKATRRLAMARPFVGAAFAVMIFLLLKSGLVDVGGLSTAEQTIYFYAAVGFLAGFSERWARVIVGGVLGADDESEAKGTRRGDGEVRPSRRDDVNGRDRPNEH
jgi:hypothetical protein